MTAMTAMTDTTAHWQTVDYEGFEIHVAPFSTNPPDPANPSAKANTRYTYIGYVCHPGADPAIPGRSVPFHADGEESFPGADEAFHEAVHIGRSIIEGTHPDLTVLPLVTGGV